MIVISIVFYLVDIKNKNNVLIRVLKEYGLSSLTLFLLHHLFLPLFISQLNIVMFIFVAFSFLAFMGFVMSIWVNYFNGVGSLEWAMGKIGGSKKR